MFDILNNQKNDPTINLDKARLISIYLQSVGMVIIFILSILAEPPQKDMEKIDGALKNIANSLDPKIQKYLKTRTLKPKAVNTSEVPEEDKNIPGLNMLRGFASKVATHGKGLLANVQTFLPGSGQSFLSVKLAAEVFSKKSSSINEIGEIDLVTSIIT